MEKLFSYGTLQQPAVQIATFGHELQGRSDALIGYVLTEIEITDEYVIQLSGKRFHPMLQRTGKTSDTIEGTVFELSPEDLAQADAYEVSLYTRKLAPLRSGGQAWVYVDVNETPLETITKNAVK